MESQRWPMWWRVTVLLNLSFYNLWGNVFAAGLSPLFPLLMQEFQLSVNQLSHMASYALLCLGLSNLAAVFSSQYIGKRWTVLISLTGFTAVCIWAAAATSYHSLLATRFVGGLFGGVVEALGPAIVADLFPERQIARAMVVYIGFLASGAALGPFFGGIIAYNTANWRWFFGFLGISAGVNLVACILMFPEPVALKPDQQPHPTTSILTDVSNCAKDEPIAFPPTEALTHQNLWDIWRQRSFFIRLADVAPKANMIDHVVRPFALLMMPSVLVSVVIFGLSIGWTVVINILTSGLYPLPPRRWNPQQIGVFNICQIVGLLVGLPVGGIFADRLSIWSARAHGGSHRARSRLPAIIPGALISPAGLLVVGFTINNNTAWIGPAFGWGMLSFGITASANVLISFATDLHPSLASSIGMLLNVTKNVLGFGLSYKTFDWYLSSGPKSQFGSMAGVLWAAYLCVIPLYFFDKQLLTGPIFALKAANLDRLRT